MSCRIIVGLLLALAAGCEQASERPREATDPRSIDGCWRIDYDDLIATNRIPRGLAPAGFRDWLEGYHLQIENGAIRQRLVVAGKTFFDRAERVVVERHGERVRVRAERWRPAEPVAVPGDPPPASFYPEVDFQRHGGDRLVAQPNFVLKAAWGFDTGPLPLRRVDCQR